MAHSFQAHKQWIIPAAACGIITLALAETAMLVMYRETWADELFALSKSYLILKGDLVPFRDGIFPYGPLVILVHGVPQYFFGPSVLAGRIVAACFLLAMLVVVWLIARRTGGRFAALVSVLLILSNVLLVSGYTSATMYAATAFLLVLLVWIEQSEISRRRKTIFTGIVSGLMMLSRINMLPALMIYAGYLFFIRVSVRQILLFLGLSLTVVALGYLPIVLPNPALAISHILSVFVSFGPIAALPPPRTDPSASEFVEQLTKFLNEYYGFLALFFVSVVSVLAGQRARLLDFLRRERTFTLAASLAFGLLAVHYFYPNFVGKLFYANYFMPVLALAAVMGAVRFQPHDRALRYLLVAVIALNFAANLYRTDVVSHPREESDLQRLARGTALIRDYTRPSDRILTFDDSLAHLYLADRRTFPALLQRDFLYLGDADTEKVRRVGFYNLAMVKEWLGEADYFLIHQESGYGPFVRLPFWGKGSEDAMIKIAEIRQIVASDYTLAASSSNVYPRKYTKGNDGGTLELYRRNKNP